MPLITTRIRTWALAGIAFVFTCVATPAAPPRLPPLRSSASDTAIKLGGVEYVSMDALARRFALRTSWVKKDERLRLKSAQWDIVLGVDSRDAQVNGMRLLLGEPCRLHRHTVYVSRVDAEKVLTPIIRPGFGEKSVPQVRTVAIDAGHGGVDNGTSNSRLKLFEKTLTLDVGLRLGRLLREQGYNVVYTREKDVKVELPLRAAAANAASADLFISIHFNSLANDTRTHGIEVFTFAPPDVRSTDAWGSRVNDTENEASPGNRYDHWNSTIAYFMQREMLEELKTFDRGKKFAHFGVLRPLKCPGVLVEAGFLSNDDEARKISTAAYRQRIAESLARGVRAYAQALAALQKK